MNRYWLQLSKEEIELIIRTLEGADLGLPEWAELINYLDYQLISNSLYER